MSERKVLNKYFPPDFDPDLIPRRKQPKNSQQVVRLMAPFSMRCNTCGEYIYKGKKFNARKETVEGEDYYGIKIFRFYIKCTLCSAEITFKTDPKNTDYSAEHGASRNFEPWREEQAVEEEDRLAKLEEEENNPMKALENRTTDSKREMDILDALQDIRARNARNERVGNSVDLLAQLGMEEVESAEDAERKRLEEEDEKLVREIFSRIPTEGATVTVKRKADDIEPSVESLLPESTRALISEKSTALQGLKKKKGTGKNGLGIKVVKRPKAMMDAREDFPRVSLATVNDWHSVKANYRSTVLDVLHEHIEAHGLGAEHDALLAHANQHIERVFSMAQPNLRINGHSFESLDQDEYNTEPFDEALDRKIWSLADTRLKWQKRIAETRRTLPQQYEATVVDVFSQQRVVDAEATAAFHTEAIEDVEPDDIDEIIPRHSYIEEGFRKTVALGEELDQTTVSQEERAERALAAAGEVKALKP